MYLAYPKVNYGNPKFRYKMIWYDPQDGLVWLHYYDHRRDADDGIRSEIDYIIIDQRTSEVVATRGNTLRIAVLMIRADEEYKHNQLQANYANP